MIVHVKASTFLPNMGPSRV